MKGLVSMVLTLGLVAWGGLQAEEESAESLFASLSPGEAEVEMMNALVDRLGADSFKDREAATEKLMTMPLLPLAVIKRARQSGDPEVRERMQKVLGSVDRLKPEDTLERALRLVIRDGSKGQLSRMTSVMDGSMGVFTDLAERAAAITAVKTDGELVAELAESEDSFLRRVAAAASEGLDGEAGVALAKGLLEDEEEGVRMRAAITLGNLKEPVGAVVLGRFLESADTVERVRAWKALRGLTGAEFGFEPLAAPAARKKAAGEWRELLESEIVFKGRAGEAEWRQLFNGRDLRGWTQHRKGVAVVPGAGRWQVKNGVLSCPGRGPGDLRTNSAYDDYVLLLKFRSPEARGDSGIGVMLLPEHEGLVAGRLDGGDYLEIQLYPGRSGDLYSIGGFEAEAGGAKIGFSHPRHADVGDDPGMWHEARVEVTKGTAAVFINGTEVNRAEKGPKGAGKILLREEKTGFEFRDIALLGIGDPE